MSSIENVHQAAKSAMIDVGMVVIQAGCLLFMAIDGSYFAFFSAAIIAYHLTMMQRKLKALKAVSYLHQKVYERFAEVDEEAAVKCVKDLTNELIGDKNGRR